MVDTNPKTRFRPRPFRLEAVWLQDFRFRNLVNSTWSQRDGDDSDIPLIDKFNILATEAKIWNRDVFGCLHKNDTNARMRLCQAQDQLSSNPSLQNKANEASCLKDYIDKVKLKEIFYAQKSRVQWLKCGNLNTRFFHLSTIIRRHRNRISCLKNDSGSWVDNEEGIELLINDYFKNLYPSKFPSIPDDLCGLLPKVISDNDNNFLTRPVTEEQIVNTVLQMGLLKSPGPDGLQGIFYKDYWDIIGPSVVSMVKKFFENGILHPDINKTFITLFPKISNPSHIKIFRPISLCNFSYKIISKILANRLKSFLPRFISPNQNAFVKDKSIFDSILITNEIFHSFQHKEGSKAWMALKIDFEKAFDCLEWDFIYKVFKSLGFNDTWINWLKLCISSVSFQVLYNGAPSDHFHPSRGIRKGDPLSPYIFISCLEVLSRMINNGLISKDITGFKICKGAPIVSHSFYADDTLIFLKATLSNVKGIRNILEFFSKWSGLSFNASKSVAVFSENLPKRLARNLSRSLQMKLSDKPGKYLGINIQWGRLKGDDFTEVLLKLTNKLSGWKNKALNFAGRDVLIKAVLDPSLNHIMCALRIPKFILDKVDKLRRNFLWHKKTGPKGYILSLGMKFVALSGTVDWVLEIWSSIILLSLQRQHGELLEILLPLFLLYLGLNTIMVRLSGILAIQTGPLGVGEVFSKGKNSLKVV